MSWRSSKMEAGMTGRRPASDAPTVGPRPLVRRALSAGLEALPFSVKQLRRELAPARRNVGRAVAENLRLPGMAMRGAISGWLSCPALATAVPKRRRRASVAGVSLVKNEVDIIGHTIEHLLSEGVEPIVVADNGSTDGTYELLVELARSRPLTIVRDTLAAFHQGTKVTRLARYAWMTGATWVLPFDADELWYSRHGRVREVLLNSNCSVALAEQWEHYPRGGEEATSNPFVGLPFRRESACPIGKVAFRAHPFAFVEEGGHWVRRPGPAEQLLEVRHLLVRSVDHAVRKWRDGKQALEMTMLDQSVGGHWRTRGGLTDEEIAAVVAAEVALVPLVYDPPPYCRHAPRQLSGGSIAPA
jgi:hypothetical protein